MNTVTPIATTIAILPTTEQTTIAMNDPIGSDPTFMASSAIVASPQKSEPLPQTPCLQHSPGLQAVSFLQRVCGDAGADTGADAGAVGGEKGTGTGVGVLRGTGAVVGVGTEPDVHGPPLHPSPQYSGPVPQYPNLLQHCPDGQLHDPEVGVLPPDGGGGGTTACGVSGTEGVFVEGYATL